MAVLPAFDFICPEAGRLAGAGPTLYCVRCDRDVHDLSAMTEAEAAAFLDGCRGKSLCVRYEQDVDSGEVLFRPERRPGRLGKVTLALGVSIAGLALGQAVVGRPAPEQARPGAGGVAAFASGPVDRLRSSVEAALNEAAAQEAAAQEAAAQEAALREAALREAAAQEAAMREAAEEALRADRPEPCLPPDPKVDEQQSTKGEIINRRTRIMGGAVAYTRDELE
ncbi:MAG: hypothetical protein R3F60_18405 [bacterium]